MPSYKDGTKVQLFDRVNAPTGVRYADGGKAEQIFSNAVVIGIDEKATSSELMVLVGPGRCMGTVNLPAYPGDVQEPRAGVILDGYCTSANAVDCQLLPRVTDAVAVAQSVSLTPAPAAG